MSRQSGGARKGIKLPYSLQQELGIEGHSTPGGRRGQNGSVTGRKEQRHGERSEKRQEERGARPQSRRPAAREEYYGGNQNDAPPTVKIAKTVRAQTNGRGEATTRRPILQRPTRRSPSPDASELSSPSSSRSSSPGLVLDSSSRAFRDRAAQDDAEISALEKRLGVKKSKASTSLAEDGLDDLLDDLDEEEVRGVKRKADGKEWLERKRRKAESDDDDENGDDNDEDFDAQVDEEMEEDDWEGTGESETGSFEGFDSDESPAPVQPKKVRENPYVPPVASTNFTGKYVPPSMRKASNSEGANIGRLKRQLQGHLNKLSEANLVSILGEIEKIYQSHARQDVASVLIDLILALFCDKSALQNTFVILHAAFATALYRVVGIDFGAELLSQLVKRFDQYHSTDSTGKEALNLLSLLSNLFTFHMISSVIIFDHIQLLLDRLSENNTELLLRLIRDCGPQLRQDDPSSLKAIVQLMQKETARMNSAGEQMSVRTKYMIETITDLKNNKMKAATNNAGLASEHITLMRKVLGSLNDKRTLRASEPLRATRDDILNSDNKGKWWLVGASWKGNESTSAVEEAVVPPPEQLLDDDSIDLLALSRQYGMNTDVRRSVFIALLSAVDYQDGHIRLLKLRLKRNQEQEIPKVLLRCAAGEKPYNQYYTLVAKKLCLDKRMRKAFQFALWAFFRRLGENPDLDDSNNEDEEEDVEMSEIANLARVYANLILDGAVSLAVLKVLDLASAKERTIMFVELMLAIILIETKNKPAVLSKVFERAAAETLQMVPRLQFFIKKNVGTSDLVRKQDQKALKKGSRAALEILKSLKAAGKEIEA